MSKRVQRIGVVAAALIIQVPVGAIIASPAFAGAAQCEANKQVCLYEDGGGGGDEYGRVRAAGEYELGGWNGDNEISSVVNATGYCVTLFANDGHTGRTLTIGPRSWEFHLADWDFNDEAESYTLWNCG
ncbi:peptidase inhibitor family I36 protein [Plantactinospora soyae]|uniref:Peptidase inhibitor family I36 n=1 Tax=Plantactinospora soyae TaxID=1544732 RepID=A0A927M6Z5_9ACTN|nr:peptidase inhibitor family I36 protein [Plantactinospora soyae]MBE1489157.1 hypothetical protein [Plantactinospora soyae]